MTNPREYVAQRYCQRCKRNEWADIQWWPELVKIAFRECGTRRALHHVEPNDPPTR
jgi:hypothetical protein